MFPRNVVSISVVLCLCALSCSTTKPIVLEPATALRHDVFACKGLTDDDHWVDLTDVFLPEKDPRVVVAAQLDPEDAKKFVQFELVNPAEAVVLTETRRYPKGKTLGIFFEMDRLMALGGKGKWKATVFSDGLPIGQSVFYIGEKVEKEAEEKGPHYFVVGEESLEKDLSEESAKSAEERLGKYIREVTPELLIPSGEKKTETPTTAPSGPK